MDNTIEILDVFLSGGHTFTKQSQSQITLLKGLGVEGDAHAGETVKHRSRVRVDPTQPNLRQVHLMASELFDEVAEKGFAVKPGDLGENITTKGIDLISLPQETILKLGSQAQIKITGLRNPCYQIDDFQNGLMEAVLVRHADGQLTRKSGVMAIVVEGGTVGAGDPIEVVLPNEPHKPLEKV